MVRVKCPPGGETKLELEQPITQILAVRVLKPPGGGSSIMFGEDDELVKKCTKPTSACSPTPAPAAEATKENVPSETPESAADTATNQSPQKPHNTNGMNGDIKSDSSPPTTPTCNNSSPPQTPSSLKDSDTKSRLFGDDTTNLPPRDITPTPRRIKDHMKSNIFTAAEESLRGVPNDAPSPGGVSKQNSTETNNATENKPTEPSQPRGRIPPGGFSTKLW